MEISLKTMPKEEYKRKLHEGMMNAEHMNDCEDQANCPRCIKCKLEGYVQCWKTGLYFSPFERRAFGEPSLLLIA